MSLMPGEMQEEESTPPKIPLGDEGLFPSQENPFFPVQGGEGWDVHGILPPLSLPYLDGDDARQRLPRVRSTLDGDPQGRCTLGHPDQTGGGLQEPWLRGEEIAALPREVGHRLPAVSPWPGTHGRLPWERDRHTDS